MFSPLLHAGLSDMEAHCLCIHRVVGAFLHSKADPSALRLSTLRVKNKMAARFTCHFFRYGLEPPIYLGLVGTILISLGGFGCTSQYELLGGGLCFSSWIISFFSVFCTSSRYNLTAIS